MQDGKFSRTAWRVALRRAAHQLLDDPKVLDDPLALRIIGPEAVAELHSTTESLRSQALRAFMVARSRFAEDELAAAVRHGVQQYVVLGAGLDTSAYRGFWADANLRIFEVDHPATQAWKRERLAGAGIPLPANLAFVAIDFERQRLAEELYTTGFQPVPTFFSCLGVTPYLTREAFDGTMSFIASLSAPSGVVFDYAVDRSALNLLQRAALKSLSARVEAAGEPFRLFFVPSELERELQAIGFSHTENLGGDGINARYFKDRADGLRVTGGLAHLMSAWR
jgi:methyltransferase (TIGR00027 family)